MTTARNCTKHSKNEPAREIWSAFSLPWGCFEPDSPRLSLHVNLNGEQVDGHEASGKEKATKLSPGGFFLL